MKPPGYLSQDKAFHPQFRDDIHILSCPPSSLTSDMAHVERGREISIPPPRGQPYSITLPGSKKEGRTPVYRHHKFKDGLLRSLDPNVATAHDMFEGSGMQNATPILESISDVL